MSNPFFKKDNFNIKIKKWKKIHNFIFIFKINHATYARLVYFFKNCNIKNNFKITILLNFELNSSFKNMSLM